MGLRPILLYFCSEFVFLVLLRYNIIDIDDSVVPSSRLSTSERIDDFRSISRVQSAVRDPTSRERVWFGSSNCYNCSMPRTLPKPRSFFFSFFTLSKFHAIYSYEHATVDVVLANTMDDRCYPLRYIIVRSKCILEADLFPIYFFLVSSVRAHTILFRNITTRK